jgi:ribonuclease VapC
VILDTSAIIAILRNEPDASRFTDAIEAAEARIVSAATYLEAAIIVDSSRDPVLSRRFDELLEQANVSIAPVTQTQAIIARAAYRDFGRGSGHPARLNFGDCLAYALAKASGEPLLFKGDDFSHTDIVAA